MISKQIVLASRPHGHPMAVNFKIEEKELPGIKTGEVLLKPLIISVDPSMLGRMHDTDPNITTSFALNQVIDGSMMATVIESKSKTFKPGDTVTGNLIWGTLVVENADKLRKINVGTVPPGYYLGVLGMPGLTAYFGLLDIGKPKAGETVVVSAAAGAVGIVVGQIAKLKGCRVIGIAGSNEKCKLLKDEFGFDEALNYKTAQPLDRAIANCCPSGVDIYFDNVGGAISDAVIANIHLNARIILCGQISSYNNTKASVGPRFLHKLHSCNASVQGFVIATYKDRFPEGLQQLEEWYKEGKLKYKQTITLGFNKLPEAFLGLFSGQNQGKMLVQIEV